MPESNDIKMKDVQQDDVSSEIDSLVKEIEQSFILLSKVATTFDNRYVSKVFRDLGPLRRKLVKWKFSVGNCHKQYILAKS